MPGQQALDDDIGIHPLGLTKARPVEIDALQQEVFLETVVVQDRDGGLDVAQGDLGIEQQIVELGRGIVPIGVKATDVDGVAGMAGHELGIGYALIIAEFEDLAEQALDPGERVFLAQALFLVALVIDIQVLAETPRRGAAARLLDLHAKVQEPPGLHGFAEGAGRIGRHLAAGLGDLEQLGLALGVFTFGRHLFRQLSITTGKADQGTHGNDGGTIKVDLGTVFRRDRQGRQALFRLGDDVVQATAHS